VKKIIIYGVKNMELRRQIENFLDDGYEIIGCSDGHYQSDIWNEYRFIPVEDLCRQTFDFVLLCAGSSGSRKGMKRNLQHYGIPPEKIMSPIVFLPGHEAKYHSDTIKDIDTHYHGEKRLIFGLSYSVCDIDKGRLKFPFYDFSDRSLDLYYNFKQYNYVERKYGPLLNLQKVFWIFSYYYFDYDMSLSAEMFRIGRMFSVWRLDDWHNYQNLPDAWEYVENYRMFGEKITQFYRIPKIYPPVQKIYEGYDNSVLLDELWFSDHEETVAENKKIFVQFYRKLTSAGCAPIIVVPPFLNILNSISQTALKKKREKFYRILKELEPEIGSVRVFDYMDRFAERRELFFDFAHLNDAGAREFTELINRELL